MKKSGNLLFDIVVVIGITLIIYIVFKIVLHILTSSLFWIILIGAVVAYFFFKYKGKRRI